MEETKVKLPKTVNSIIRMLEEAGYRADAVGGAVRDALLGNYAFDYDITTSATPSQIKKVFNGYRVIETGIKHGTVTVISNNIPYEITTYRIDGEYKDNRHPVSVSFTKKIEEDLARRDFTVNAMAYSESRGLTDCFGGLSDLKNRIIRAVGDPDLRFSEDALRILRAVRFSSTLGFDIEEKTADALIKHKDKLASVSVERITVEWRKLLMGEFSLEVLKKYKSVILTVIPELAPLKLPSSDVWNQLNELERDIALFALNCGSKEYETAMKRMKSESIRLKFGATVLKCMENPPNAEKASVIDFLLNYNDDIVLTTLRVGSLLGLTDKNAYVMAKEAINDNVPRTPRMLKISGYDIMALGLRGGAVGELLWEILHIAASGDCENEEEALFKLATGLAEKYK